MNAETHPRDPAARIAEYKRGLGDNSFMRAQGLTLEWVAAGQVIVRLDHPQPAQRGGGGSAEVINGGVVAYMFDAALAFSITSGLLALPQADTVDFETLGQVTINLDITYLDAARGDRFEAHGSVIRVSRSTAFAEGRLLDAQGKLCATAKGIWRIFWPRSTVGPG